MSREVRKVDPYWQHPIDQRGYFIPLFDGSDFESRLVDWELHRKRWEDGLIEDYANGGWKDRSAIECDSFEEWYGKKPDPVRYMPTFEDCVATHFVMYETVTEGTPISPAFPSLEELAHWLADNGASAGAGATASYEQWLAMARQGSCLSMAIVEGKVISGVELASYRTEDLGER